MNGTILVNNLCINCIIGIHPHERVNLQQLYIDLKLTTDFTKVAAEESIQHTIDYTAVAALVEEHIVTQKYELIETLAVRVGQLLFNKFDALQQIQIEVRKPAAVHNTAYVGVALELKNPKY